MSGVGNVYYIIVHLLSASGADKCQVSIQCRLNLDMLCDQTICHCVCLVVDVAGNAETLFTQPQAQGLDVRQEVVNFCDR